MMKRGIPYFFPNLRYGFMGQQDDDEEGKNL